MSIRVTGGAYRGRRFRLARVAGLRPTTDAVRSAVFSILGPEAVAGARVLDLYAGTGAMGIEALSRGAKRADFVEVNAKLARRIRENLTELSLVDRGHVYRFRADAALSRLHGRYDLVFADPPYAMDAWDSLMGMLIEGELTEEGSIVVLEHHSATELAESYGTLVKATSRRYGDTVVSFFSHGEAGG